jgi:hypothetical protein
VGLLAVGDSQDALADADERLTNHFADGVVVFGDENGLAAVEIEGRRGFRRLYPICDKEKLAGATCAGTQRTQRDSRFPKASFRCQDNYWYWKEESWWKTGGARAAPNWKSEEQNRYRNEPGRESGGEDFVDFRG